MRDEDYTPDGASNDEDDDDDDSVVDEDDNDDDYSYHAKLDGSSNGKGDGKGRGRRKDDDWVAPQPPRKNGIRSKKTVSETPDFSNAEYRKYSEEMSERIREASRNRSIVLKDFIRAVREFGSDTAIKLLLMSQVASSSMQKSHNE